MNKKGMLTIKELADSLDLPKSKINYQVSKLDSEYIVVLNGIKHLTKDGQTLIKQSLGLHDVFENSSKSNSNLDGFEQLFKHFESQLNAKNQQIDKLHTLLDQQQQLTLQRDKQIDKLQFQLDTKESKNSDSEELEKETIENTRQQLDQLKSELEQKNLENEELKVTVEELNQPPKKSFWQRLFNQ